MKRKLLVATCLGALAFALGLETVGVNNTLFQTSAADATYYVSSDPFSYSNSGTPAKTTGFGGQFDMCALDKYNRSWGDGTPNGAHSATDWSAISSAVVESGLDRIRIRFYPEAYERENDNDDPNVLNEHSIIFINS